MSDYIIDADPFIPSGVPATVEQVTAMVVDGILPAAKVADLAARQQPDDVKAAVLDAIAWNVYNTDAVVADYTDVLKDIGATKTEANTAVKDIGIAATVTEEPSVEPVAEDI